MLLRMDETVIWLGIKSWLADMGSNRNESVLGGFVSFSTTALGPKN